MRQKLQDKRATVIKLKKADPSMRFRIETNLGPLQSLTTTKQSEQGLEAPESFFVELADYESEYGPADPSDIISELVDGKHVQGVLRMHFGISII